MNRILIVEDEKAIADMVRLCLVKNGYLCDTASDGGEAAEKAEKNHYDLVLLDVMLPDIDGYELIDYIKQFDIPVIFPEAPANCPAYWNFALSSVPLHRFQRWETENSPVLRIHCSKDYSLTK